MGHVPWLLAIGSTGFEDLGAEWACTGLGHKSMSAAESQLVRHSGFDKRVLRTLGLHTDDLGYISPFLATCAQQAKLLQFDGPMVPWQLSKLDTATPVCALPSILHSVGS